MSVIETCLIATSTVPRRRIHAPDSPPAVGGGLADDAHGSAGA